MNGNYQNYNNNFNGYFFTESNPFMGSDLFFRKRNEKAVLKKLSFYAGSAILLSLLIQNLAVILLIPLGLYDFYLENQLFQGGFGTILSVAGLLLPFAVLGKKMKQISGEAEPVPINIPISKGLAVLAVFGGVGACLMANYATSFVTIIMAVFGYELSSPDIAMPTGALGVTLTFVRISVLTAVVEELSLRGYVMGNLRKYGDRFAIVMSAFVFAFIHGNLIQTPFALIAGFVLGYLCVKTGSLWTGVFIHAINNAISVAVTYLIDVLPEKTINSLYGIIMLVFISVGGVCFYIFVNRTKHITLRKNSSLLSSSERALTYLLSPTMVCSMLVMLYITITYISKI